MYCPKCGEEIKFDWYDYVGISPQSSPAPLPEIHKYIVGTTCKCGMGKAYVHFSPPLSKQS